MYIYLSRNIKISSVAVMGLFLYFCVCGWTYGCVFLFCVALHEAGHLLAAAKISAGIRQFTLLPLGADIRLDRVISYKEDVFIALSGPAASFASALAAYLLSFAARYEEFELFAACSLIYGVLNLLPVGGLDGGRALCALCLQRDAPQLYTAVSLAALFVLWQAGIFFLFYTSFNASLLLVCIYLFYTVYFKENCG